MSIDLGEEADDLLNEGDEGDEFDDYVLSSPLIPVVKELIKRIVKTARLLKDQVASLRGAANATTTSSPEEGPSAAGTAGSSHSTTEENRRILLSAQELYHFLWSRLLSTLNEEHERCSDAYTKSLDMKDRIPFESLTNAIHHNTVFCDAMGEFLDFNYENQPYENEDGRDDVRAILTEYYSSMEHTQVTASHCAAYVVEGSQESFLDPVSMHDLCKIVSSEKRPRKRLVPLSLMFSMLGQDESTVSEAFSQQIPKILLQRFRHRVHQVFGHFTHIKGSEDGAQSHRQSPQRYRSAVVGSDADSRMESRRSSPMRSPIAADLDTTEARQFGTGEEAALENTNPLESPLPRATQNTFKVGKADFDVEPPRKRHRRSRSSTPLRAKLTVLDDPVAGMSLPIDCWVPLPGDRVGRGPGWKNDEQGRGCDYGVVDGVTQNNEVLVHWIPSLDSSSAKENEESHFLYRYDAPHYEVVKWEEYLRVKTMTTTGDDVRMFELLQLSAVIGVLCEQKDAILPALQFQAIESTLHVMDSTEVGLSSVQCEHIGEETERQIRRHLISHGVSEAEVEHLTQSILSWDPTLRAMQRRYREDKEILARMGWVLNALLSHKVLALHFLDADGVRRVLDVVKGPMEVSITYGCTIILSHLAKAAVFEELLRRQRNYFEPIMCFIIDEWKHSTNSDVQSSVGAFLFHSLSFPCVLAYFEKENGPIDSIEALEKCLKMSEEHFDVLHGNLLLALLKCLNVYLVSHLMLATKVIFRKHRVLSSLVTRSSPFTSLPRDPPTVEAILSFLSSPSSALPDVSAENVQSLLTAERLNAIQRLIDKGVHLLFLRCSNFFFIQSRWELLMASLLALCALTVVPYVRQLIVEVQSNESGIAQLLSIVNELSVSYQHNNTSREIHLLPCVVSALQILIHIIMPPTEGADESAVANFNNACSAFRANDGIRVLLEVLKVKQEASMSAKLNYFPVVARAVHLMTVLRRYSDTCALFDALNVHRIAQELLTQYASVQREYFSMIGARKLQTELGPAGRFIDNVKCFMPSAFGESNHADVVKVHTADPLEMEQRQAIINRAVVDYSQQSLLMLIAQHLHSEGFQSAVTALQREGNLPPTLSTTNGVPAHLTIGDSTAGKGNQLTLDGLVRSFLRQQQERCPNPIETLPQFDLTKKHMYLPPPTPLDEMRNEFNRLLERRCGGKRTLRMQSNENWLTYRNPSFIFEVRGGGDGLQGESIAFCDDGDVIVIGTSEGAIHLFDTFPEDPSDEKLLEEHPVFEHEAVSQLVISDNGSLIAAVSDAHKMCLMSRSALPVQKLELTQCRALRFAHDNTMAVVTADEEHICRVHDLVTGTELYRFSDHTCSGENPVNVGLFDATSQLVLNDAILWDLRCASSPVFRFDRITESFASAFHPSNQMVLIDEKVWDLRTWRMTQTIPTFQKTSSFHRSGVGKVIYSFREASTMTNTTSPIVSAVDSYTFESIFSEEVRPAFRAFAVDPSDRYCAAIADQDVESVIRLFTTSAGPYPDRGAFASPVVQEESMSDVEEAEEDEVDGWTDDFSDSMESNETSSGGTSSNTHSTDTSDYESYTDTSEEDEEA